MTCEQSQSISIKRVAHSLVLHQQIKLVAVSMTVLDLKKNCCSSQNFTEIPEHYLLSIAFDLSKIDIEASGRSSNSTGPCSNSG